MEEMGGNVSGGIIFDPMGANYIVAYNIGDDITCETCNQGALFSRLTNYFKGKGEEKIESIQVIVVNKRPPYLEEISEKKLREMWGSHKKGLEQRVSS